jgi:SAM-dependent methyltransferase
LVEWYEVAFDRLYPVLYPHRDDEEARRAAASFGALLDERDPVLDLACGNGRYMDAFAGAGRSMVGLDLSPYLLGRAAGSPSRRGRLVQGDMRALPFRDACFGGVVNMFTSFGYFDDDAENRSVLGEVARVLRGAGVFLIDFINAGPVLSAPLGRSRRESGGYTIDEDRALTPDRRQLVKHVCVARRSDAFHIEYEERVRLFTPDQLRAMLGGAGLDVTEVFGDYDGGAFDPTQSPRVIMACVRRR